MPNQEGYQYDMSNPLKGVDISNFSPPQNEKEIRLFRAGYHYGREGHGHGNCPHTDRFGSRSYIIWMLGWVMGRDQEPLPEWAQEAREEQKEGKSQEEKTAEVKRFAITQGERNFQKVPLDQIDLGTRFREEYGDIESLANNIKNNGVLQPVSLLNKSEVDSLSELKGELNPDKPFLLMAGGRRIHASRAAGLTQIPAYVFDHPMTEKEIRMVELMENMFRKQLEPAEEVSLVREIHQHMEAVHGRKKHHKDTEGWGQSDTANLLGEDPANVSRKLELAEAMEEDPKLAEAKSQSQARKMLRQRKREKANQEYMEQHRRKIEQQKASDEGKRKELLRKRYQQGDFFELIGDVKRSTIDLVEIDPPYGINYDEITNKESFRPKYDGYEDLDRDSFELFLKSTLEEADRVTKDNSWIVLWFHLPDWYCNILNWLEDFSSFRVNPQPAFWNKSVGFTRAPNYRLAADTDSFLYIRKGTPAIQQKGRSNVFDFPFPSSKERSHPNEGPIELYEEIFRTFVRAGSNILVPFAGSGNSILAAHNLEMEVIGYDQEQKYKNAFDKKVLEGTLRNYKSYRP